MGYYLSEQYGDDFVVFGFAFHEGEYLAHGEVGLGVQQARRSGPGTVEWVLHQSGLPRLILDLRQVTGDSQDSAWLRKRLDSRNIGGVATENEFTPMVLTDHFDVLVYFDQTHPVTLLEIPRRFPP
jgi:erythromycin esterase-like protein